MKLIKNKKQLVFVVLAVIVTLVIGTVLFMTNRESSSAPPGMREVSSYNANGICQAINDPECGYCPNKPVDGKCYVKKGELEQYQ